MAKRRRRIFSVKTPVGYRVFLERDRWRLIARNKHPALAGHDQAVRTCLESPAPVRASTTESERTCVTPSPTMPIFALWSRQPEAQSVLQ